MVFSQNSEHKKFRKSESPEVTKGTFRDCKQSPRSRESPDFGSSPIRKEFLASMYKGKHTPLYTDATHQKRQGAFQPFGRFPLSQMSVSNSL